MNHAPSRSLFAHCAIGLSLCVGGYLALVSPVKSRLQAARADLAQARAEDERARAVQGSVRLVMERAQRAEDQAGAMSRGGAPARNQDTLFTVLARHAAEAGVRIDEFNPAEPAAGAPGFRPGDVAVRCRLAVSGSYGGVAEFLSAVGNDCGFASVRTVRLAPSNDAQRPVVLAEVETEHYAVNPEPLREVQR